MRTRLGGIAVAVALALSACGSDGAGPAPTAHPDEPVGAVDLEMVSARDTLPPAPPSAGALTVVLTHPGGAGDAGLDAAAAALAQRPDIGVTIAVAGDPGATTMSGFPVSVTGATAADAVDAALAADADGAVDLVVVGIGGGPGIGATSPEAEAAAQHDVPALVVGAGPGDPPDLAAAAMQLLEVLDLELDRLLDGAHRLAVPSCEHGMLRGRLVTRSAATTAPADLRSDCTATVVPAASEAEAYASGYATLTPLG